MATEARTVGKRAVPILLECLLVDVIVTSLQRLPLLEDLSQFSVTVRSHITFAFVSTGFPPTREIKENFEDFLQ